MNYQTGMTFNLFKMKALKCKPSAQYASAVNIIMYCSIGMLVSELNEHANSLQLAKVNEE